MPVFHVAEEVDFPFRRASVGTETLPLGRLLIFQRLVLEYGYSEVLFEDGDLCHDRVLQLLILSLHLFYGEVFQVGLLFGLRILD